MSKPRRSTLCHHTTKAALSTDGTTARYRLNRSSKAGGATDNNGVIVACVNTENQFHGCHFHFLYHASQQTVQSTYILAAHQQSLSRRSRTSVHLDIICYRW